MRQPIPIDLASVVPLSRTSTPRNLCTISAGETVYEPCRVVCAALIFIFFLFFYLFACLHASLASSGRVLFFIFFTACTWVLQRTSCPYEIAAARYSNFTQMHPAPRQNITGPNLDRITTLLIPKTHNAV